LIPLNLDNEVKIEFVNLYGMEELQFSDSASNDSSSTTEFIEVVTAEEEITSNDNDGNDLDSKLDNDSGTPVHRPRKRAKLDHLSVEQKAQHRKMMNRISAQSARDRQRALMMQQEQNISAISTKNTQLQQENTKLKLANEKLAEECANLKSSVTECVGLKQENLKLRNLVADFEKKLKAYNIGSETNQEKVSEPNCGTLEPAVLDTYPQLKGQSLQQTSAYLLLMSAFFLWISTPQKFSELLKTFQNKYSATTQSLNSNRASIMKQLLHHLQLNVEQAPQTKLKPPD